MKIECGSCLSKFRADDSKIPLDGTWVNCPKCGNKLFIKREPKNNSNRSPKRKKVDKNIKYFVLFYILIFIPLFVYSIILYNNNNSLSIKINKLSETNKELSTKNTELKKHLTVIKSMVDKQVTALEKQQKDTLHEIAIIKSMEREATKSTQELIREVRRSAVTPEETETHADRVKRIKEETNEITSKNKDEDTNIKKGLELAYKSKSGYAASISKEWLSQAVDMATKHDYAAFNRMMGENKIFSLQPGLIVYIEDSSFLGGWIKIRPEGQTTCYYTVREAVESIE